MTDDIPECPKCESTDRVTDVTDSCSLRRVVEDYYCIDCGFYFDAVMMRGSWVYPATQLID